MMVGLLSTVVLTGFARLIRSLVYIYLGELGVSKLKCRFLDWYPGPPVPGGTDAPQRQRLRGYFRGSILGNLCGGVVVIKNWFWVRSGAGPAVGSWGRREVVHRILVLGQW